MTDHLLAMNAGSSNTKFALFDVTAPVPRLVLRARLEGLPDGGLRAWNAQGDLAPKPRWRAAGKKLNKVIPDLLSWFERRLGAPISAVGHRVVHGGPDFSEPVKAGEEALRALHDLTPLAPLHQAQSLAAVRAIQLARPALPQALVFDTAFHRGHDPVVDRLGLPRAWEGRGLRRYGFHGLSYEYLAERLAELDPAAAAGRVIAAHLGSGASLCAIRAGRSVDTTMGATPLDGLLMGTRCGALDPGAILFLQQALGFDPAALTDLLYRQSGLLGVSGISGDMRVLLESQAASAGEAVELFVFRVAREAAALTGSLGGLDAFVFSAGIGENAPRVRAAICRKLAWLGVELDGAANLRGDARISSSESRVAVWVIPTDEEQMIARHTLMALGMSASDRAGAGSGRRVP
jgi:acetate kinase